jgi:hypothetical protein
MERYVLSKYLTSFSLSEYSVRIISFPFLSRLSHKEANNAELADNALRISTASEKAALATVAED